MPWIVKKQQNPIYTGGYVLMPIWYRVLLWVVIAIIFGMTAWVWYMGWLFRELYSSGIWLPVEPFAHIFLGFHFLMLAESLLGWGMQTLWHDKGYMALLPLGLVIGALAMIFAGLQLHLILSLVTGS